MQVWMFRKIGKCGESNVVHRKQKIEEKIYTNIYVIENMYVCHVPCRINFELVEVTLLVTMNVLMTL